MKKFIIYFLFLLLGLNVFANDDVAEVSNYTELKNAIDDYKQIIVLTNNIVFGEPLVVSSHTNLTSKESAFNITGGTITAPLLTFTEAYSSIANINFINTVQTDSPYATVFINVPSSGELSGIFSFVIENVTFSNNLTSTTSAMGGALHINSEDYVQIMNSHFSSNSVSGIGSVGGALYYNGTPGLIVTNTEFSSNTAQRDGGAIYASTATIIGSTFTGNSTSIENGGAIYISSGTIQNSVFSSNTALQDGGAIYASTATIQKVVFKDNMAGWGNGGAVYITDSATIEDSSFLNNNSREEGGGAIYNSGTIQITNTTFNGNKAVNGGALYNTGTAVISEGQFINNNSNSDGGAIYNEGTLEINDSEFSGNKSSGSGGAIFVETGSSLTLNNSVEFTNNSAEGNGGAIYVNNAALNLNLNGKTVTFRGNTDTSGDNDIYLNGSSTFSINGGGTVNFYGGVLGGNIVSNNANINWYTTNAYDGDLSLTGGALNIMAQNADAFNTVSLNSAALSIQNGAVDNFSPSSLSITGDIPLYIDVDLSAGTVDTVNNVSGSGTFNINSSNQLNILNDASTATDFYVTTSGTLNINEDEEYYGPIYAYNLEQLSGGFRVTQIDRLNPTISALPVAANSKVVANINTVNSLYNRIDVMLSREYLEYKNKDGLQNNPYVRMLEEEMDNVSSQSSKDEWKKMIWFIPNAGYQKVDFGNDVGEVKNTFYGGLAGVDYPYWISDTSAFIPTIFAGYLGSRQKYQKTTLDNNSLAVGGMFTYMKDFAILSGLVYVTNGSENYKFKTYSGDFDIFSFTASLKGELNLNLADHIVVQPAFTVMYNLSNLQNYTTANYANIQSTRFHNLLLTPSVKFMIDADGWFPYAGISYNFSQKQKGDVTADDLAITKYKLKNFGEISVGIENTFLKYYSGYAQVSAYTGSSKGVSFEMGLRGYLN